MSAQHLVESLPSFEFFAPLLPIVGGEESRIIVEDCAEIDCDLVSLPRCLKLYDPNGETCCVVLNNVCRPSLADPSPAHEDRFCFPQSFVLFGRPDISDEDDLANRSGGGGDRGEEVVDMEWEERRTVQVTNQQ